MKAAIKSIHLENFKGVKAAEYTLDGRNAKITGQNGVGKTTIAEAYVWLMADKNYSLASNPNIRPLGVEECTPRVEITFFVDGREVTAAKIQKCTVKKSKTGGADAISLSNSYEVNAVEYGERDFKKKMQEYGFDFDLFLPLSHPDVFTSQKSADMRKVLFGMASEKSDKEIADLTDGAEDVAAMLVNYTAEEIGAMQNATLRKIKEEYGKDGEILRAKIEGMEQTKTDIDVAELELHRNLLNEQITKNRAAQDDISKQFEEQQKASDGVMELKFKLSELQQKANAELDEKRREVRAEINQKNTELREIEKQLDLNQRDIRVANESIESKTARIKAHGEKWTSLNSQLEAEQERIFDDSSLVCPYCKQEYPEEKKEQLRGEFESHKAKEIERIRAEMESIVKQGNDLQAAIKQDREETKQLDATFSENKKFKADMEAQISELETRYNAISQTIDISGREDVLEIQRQIAEKEAAMNQGGGADEIRQQLASEAEDLRRQLTEVEKQLALAAKNNEIDEQIAALREKQGQYEQNRAAAEGILEQLKMVGRRENELLTEAINAHFELVDFKLFDWQKNGEYKEVCVPTYKGKDMGTATNTGLEILIKLDIVRGLQEFYGLHFPVFVDGAEALSEATMEQITMDCQIIYLSVSEDKELRIEVEQ